MKFEEINLNSKTFIPVKIDQNGVATWRVNEGTVADAMHLTLQARISRSNTASKVTAKMTIPYWFTPKGDKSKQGREVLRVDLAVALPPNCSDELRSQIVNDLQALCQANFFTKCIRNLEAVY